MSTNKTIPLMNLQRLHEKIMPEIRAAIDQVINNGHFINGPQVKEFETAFAKLSGLKYIIGCANGTDAITVLLKALNIGYGDEVILPTMTFIATSEAVTSVGAKVVLADIKTDTYCIDPGQVERLITSKTKAVIAVHLHGNVADVDKLKTICQKHNLLLIEDSAQAHLAKWQNQPIGSFGSAATFSFFPGKNLGAMGDAGAIGTNDEVLAQKLYKLVNHGRLDKYKHDLEGYNMRIDTLQAAILLAKLKYLPHWTEVRHQKAKQYRKLLSNSKVILPFHHDDMQNVYHLFVIRVQNRDKLLHILKEHGIEAGVHYPIPLHLQPAYAYLKHQKGDFPIAEQCANEFLSLPLCSEITDEEQSLVAKTVLQNL